MKIPKPKAAPAKAPDVPPQYLAMAAAQMSSMGRLGPPPDPATLPSMPSGQ